MPIEGSPDIVLVAACVFVGCSAVPLDVCLFILRCPEPPLLCKILPFLAVLFLLYFSFTPLLFSFSRLGLLWRSVQHFCLFLFSSLASVQVLSCIR